MQRIFSCITQAVAIEGRFAPDALATWTFGQRWVPMAGSRDLEFSLLVRYRLLPHDDDPRAWSVLTAGYFHQFRKRDGDEVVRFEWHPVPGQVPWPHVHVHDIGSASPLSARTHIPTGHVSPEAIVRFAADELGVRPLRQDWHRIIADGSD